MANTDLMTNAEFRGRFPEFGSGLGDTLLDSLLLSASDYVNPVKFRSFTREAHGLKAAHLAALSPYARNLKLINTAGESNYSMQFRDIVKQMSEKIAVL